ncbi:MAG: DUF4962 domain-containing protein [Kiritimatiellae bacterium]|nr:DUF4962 domain-containing protein [Kiritimatiellia bacterium]
MRCSRSSAVKFCLVALVLGCGTLCAAPRGPVPFRESVDRENALGARPVDGSQAIVNPVAFVWAPQRSAVGYELEYVVAGGEPLLITNLVHNAYCPAVAMTPGDWTWRVRFRDARGRLSAWSQEQRFTLPADAPVVITPDDATLFSRIPREHPRLFMRPEELAEYRANLKGRYAAIYKNLKWLSGRFIKAHKGIEEPKEYAGEEVLEKGKDRSPSWKKRWWGNREYVLKHIGGAAMLGFYWRLSGDEAAASCGREILLAAAKWNPTGATGFRYNDEAGMPFFSRFARAYSYLNDCLSEDEKVACRRMMAIRGEEMYRHLCPRLFFNPYDSHGNRAWHFLGEGAVAFWDEIPEARKWLSFALDYYRCVYPVWGDSDGGWHEGPCYWTSYMDRFFWWGDIMQNTFGVNVFEKPHYAKAGDFALYQNIPGGFPRVGFGDCTEYVTPKSHARAMSHLAVRMQNPYWQWYAEQAGTPREDHYIEFLRLGQPRVTARPPVDIPTSRLFRGTGLAMLNTCLTNAMEDVQVLFKSDPTLGLFSHGFDANNSFLLNAFGDRVFVHSGIRDCYGTRFHRDWMWHVKSVNGFAATGDTQIRHKLTTCGAITKFETSATQDHVAGLVGDIWEKGMLKQHARAIWFRKTPPERVLIVDRAEAKSEPVNYSFYLHTPMQPFAIASQHEIRAVTSNAVCDVDFVWPENLVVSQTDQYDPPIGFGIKLVEHHLEARTAEPAPQALFVTVLAPRRRDKGERPVARARLEGLGLDQRVVVPLENGEIWTVTIGQER